MYKPFLKTNVDTKQEANQSQTILDYLLVYLQSFISKPWSFIFLINISCLIILSYLQYSRQVICAEDSVCAFSFLSDLQSSLFNNRLASLLIYIGFYFLGLFTMHIYSVYSHLKQNVLLARLAECVAMFFLVLLIIFTCTMLYRYFNSTAIIANL
jgi:hypothetical protein